MADKHSSTKELRGLPDADLQAQVEKLQREIWHNRVKARDGSLQQTHVLSAARKQIARLRTIQREKRT